MLNVWTEPSGYTFAGISGIASPLTFDKARTTFDGSNTSYDEGALQERVNVSIPLPVSSSAGITFTIISGSLPDGLHIEGAAIVGVPFNVLRNTTYEFCIRANDGTNIDDRTFKIIVNGGQLPEFVTNPGLLPVGDFGQLYTVADSFVNYQLEAFDPDGQALTYFISSDDGRLPPGVTLSSSGLLSGFVKPVLSLSTTTAGAGTYDEGLYDAAFYDFAYRSTDGYDSYVYDTYDFDYNVPTKTPTVVNQTYEFLVSVSAGNNIAKRKFSIFVVGDESFYADYTQLTDDTLLFTADNTGLRKPIWLTDSNLGVYRADNYATIALETLFISNTNPVTFTVKSANEEISAVSKQILIIDNVINGSSISVVNASAAPEVGQYFSLAGSIVGATNQLYLITEVVNVGVGEYRIYFNTDIKTGGSPLLLNIPDGLPIFFGSLSVLPPGLTVNPVDTTVYLAGVIPFQPAVSKTYKFTVIATRAGSDYQPAVNHRTFSITVIGEINNSIKWNSNTNLGTLAANYVSTLSVGATTTDTNSTIIYTLDLQNKETGLPPGLTLNPDGNITGKVNQYGVKNITRVTALDEGTLILDRGFTTVDNNHQYDIPGVKGLILFDSEPPELPGFSIDAGSTTFDRVYTFTVAAEDQYGFASNTKQFSVTISTPNDLLYSNIKAHPFLKPAQRDSFRQFINDPNIFSIANIYRPSDSNFGIQKNLDMLIYAGIQTASAAAYMGAIGLNHKRKKFMFGNVKTALAIENGVTIYEVVYIEMIDPLEPNGAVLPSKVSYFQQNNLSITADISNAIWAGQDKISTLNIAESWLDRPIESVTVDENIFEVSDKSTNTYYPSSISNWQKRIAQTTVSFDSNGNPVAGATERNYLPLWMRTIQPGQKQQLGFKLAVPLCYCKPGQSATIALNIKNSGFDFKTLDYTVDRYIIDSVEGYSNDKYLVFKNDRITV